MNSIQKAIREFKPDVVYAEFRPAAIVAARMEHVPVATGYSYPARTAYASSPQYGKGVRRFLQKNGLQDIDSVLDIFEWADLKIVPSCYELEPIDDPKVVFTGPFLSPSTSAPAYEKRNSVLVYMGNGSISYKTQLAMLRQAFQGTGFSVYIASYKAEAADYDNIHVARRFDFRTLLPQAITFVNHGGQNSVLSAVMYGVPQIIFPGNVFERRYNADSVERLCMGKHFSDAQFDPATLRQTVAEMQVQTSYKENISMIRTQLSKLGGVEKAIQSLLSIC